MGLFGNRDKTALEESLEGVLGNVGANNGNLDAEPVARRVQAAEQLIDKMCSKGKGADVKQVLSVFAARKPARLAFGRNPAEAQAAMDQMKREGRTGPTPKAEASWAELMDRFHARAQ